MSAKLLTDDGRLVVHVPDDLVPVVLRAVEKTDLYRREWIVWHYRFGQNTNLRFVPSKCHALVFGREKQELVWNLPDVLVPSDRAAKYADARTQDTEYPGMRAPFDVWGADVITFGEHELPGDGEFWGRVPGNSAEPREIHNNQLPELYLARFIRAYTHPGDWALDPFAGSGTTQPTRLK